MYLLERMGLIFPLNEAHFYLCSLRVRPLVAHRVGSTTAAIRWIMTVGQMMTCWIGTMPIVCHTFGRWKRSLTERTNGAAATDRCRSAVVGQNTNYMTHSCVAENKQGSLSRQTTTDINRKGSTLPRHLSLRDCAGVLRARISLLQSSGQTSTS